MLKKFFDRITRLSLRLRWVTITLAVLLLAAGVFALTQFNQELIPPVEFPQSVVLAMYQGATPDETLEQVTIPIENAVRDIDGVVYVESNTGPGYAAVIISNEYGLDQDALRDEIQAAVSDLDYPAEVETPELLSFSMSDLPLTTVSISSSELTLAELKELVESEVVPQLEAVDGVARVEVGGGQELPAEVPAVAQVEEPAATATPTPEPTATPTKESAPAGGETAATEPEPVPLPASWVQAGAAQGTTLETTADLTAAFVGGIASFAPQMLNELTPEMLLAMPLDALAALPQDDLAGLDADTQMALAQRAVEAPVEVAAEPEPIPLPASWVQAAAAQGMTLETTADLTARVVGGIASFAPQMLDELTPEMLLAMPLDALEALPQNFMDTLEPDLKAELERIAAGEIEAFIPTDSINRTDGQPSLALTIYKNTEANTVSVTHAIFYRLEELVSENGTLRTDTVFEQASFIEESIHGVAREGGLGALFAVLVILLFLSGLVNGRYKLSWRSTLVTAVSIPLSVMMGFALLKWLPPTFNSILSPLAESAKDVAVIGALVAFLLKIFPTGITLNIMTLSGMTVAVGRVVDDSIVVLENIYRHIQRGDDPRRAVIDGTRDVAIPIFASTVTTVVVFLPIGLMGGMIGNFFLPFGMTVTYALLSSFAVAVTVVPLLAYLFIRKEHLPPVQEETGLQKAYTPVLKWALGHRLWTLVIASVVFMGSLWLLSQRPQTFIPDLGESTINVSVDLPNGTTMAETDGLVREMEAALGEMDGIQVYQSQIGTSGGMQTFFMGSSIDQSVAVIDVYAASQEDLERLTGPVRQQAEAIFGLENATVAAGAGMTGGATSGFDLVVAGPPEALAEVDGQIIQTLEKVDGLVNITSNLADANTIVRVNGQPAVRYGGDIESRNTMGVLAAGKSAVEEMEGLPDGASVSEGFMARVQTEGFAQSGQALLISIVVVYLVMVATFGSLAHPFVILFSLPLAVVGAALGLWITDKVVGISAMVGLMMLVGIVVTNAIVLIDRVRVNRRERGMGIYDALVEGGRTRLRPILMTAIAAILALVPLGLGLTEGALIASDLAVVVIGGLLTSTLLTLLVVPVAYSLVESVLHRLPSRK